MTSFLAITDGVFACNSVQTLARQAEERRRQAELEKEREEIRKRNMEVRAIQETRKAFEVEQRQRERKITQLGDQLISHSVLRLEPLGMDRERRAYYFVDGIGASAGNSSGAGRLLICENGAEWSYYASPEQVDELIASLNSKGIRECALRKVLIEHKDRIAAAMRRRQKVRWRGVESARC